MAKGQTGHPPSAKGTTIKALSTKTVFVRCWDTPTDSGSLNFTKQTREVTGKGESLEENTDVLCKEYENQRINKPSLLPGKLVHNGFLRQRPNSSKVI